VNWQGFLNDDYFKWIMGNYSILLFVVIPWAVVFGLKVWAIISPSAPANRIVELFQGMYPSKVIDGGEGTGKVPVIERRE
jgi:hypothetical protein